MRTSYTNVTLYAFLLTLHGIASSEPMGPESMPPELTRFVAGNETLLAHESADLNGDGLRDMVFIVEPKKRDKNDQTEDEGIRTLKIAVRAPDGSLKIAKQSTKAVYCRSCGGMFGDPFDSLAASNKSFSVHHYGGSAWRWTHTFTFAYSKRDNTWQLVRVDESGFHTSDPEKQTSKSYRPPRHFGKIDIAEFDPEHFEGVGPK